MILPNIAISIEFFSYNSEGLGFSGRNYFLQIASHLGKNHLR